MSSPLVRSVGRLMPLPAEPIFALLADPRRHPDIDGAQSVRGVKASDGTLTQGSTFTMNMKRGFSYSTRNTVVEYEPDRIIAWQTRPITFPLPLLVGGRIWRYELSEARGGTLVRETWDIRGERNRRLVSRLGDDTEQLMEESLARLQKLAGG